jgi:hypothetical protein
MEKKIFEETKSNLINVMFGLVLPKAVLRSRSRKEPHHLVGAGAVIRCGSGGSGSDNGIKHG